MRSARYELVTFGRSVFREGPQVGACRGGLADLHLYAGEFKSGLKLVADKTRLVDLSDQVPELLQCLVWFTCRCLNLCGSDYSLIPIDCENVTSEELRELPYEGKLEGDKVIVYLDEIAALRRRRLEGMLLKLIDETPAIWIASAISLKRTKGARKGELTERMSKEMRGRFAIKVGSSHPHADDLQPWIVARCTEWNITILEPEVTIPEMIRRTCRRAGYLIHIFAEAATRRDRTIGPDDVTGFQLDSTD